MALAIILGAGEVAITAAWYGIRGVYSLAGMMTASRDQRDLETRLTSIELKLERLLDNRENGNHREYMQHHGEVYNRNYAGYDRNNITNADDVYGDGDGDGDGDDAIADDTDAIADVVIAGDAPALLYNEIDDLMKVTVYGEMLSENPLYNKCSNCCMINDNCICGDIST